MADPNAPPASGLPFTEQSRYDIKGRQTLHVSFEGVVTRFQYDDTPHGNGRLIEKQFFDNLTHYNAGIPVDYASEERQLTATVDLASAELQLTATVGLVPAEPITDSYRHDEYDSRGSPSGSPRRNRRFGRWSRSIRCFRPGKPDGELTAAGLSVAANCASAGARPTEGCLYCGVTKRGVTKTT